MWCLPAKADPAFVAAMEAVLDVYERPHDPFRPGVLGDEAGKRLVVESREALPTAPGSVTEKRTRVDFAGAVRDRLDGRYKDAAKVGLFLDNLNTHPVDGLYAASAPAEAERLADRLEVHHTPKHGSWLNVAECELSVPGRQCPDRRIPDREALAAAAASRRATSANSARSG